MPDSFTPLVSVIGSPGEDASCRLKVLTQAESKSVFEALPISAPPGADGKSCGQPSIVLQRTGDAISGIRVQCACGQVIELACSY